MPHPARPRLSPLATSFVFLAASVAPAVAQVQGSMETAFNHGPNDTAPNLRAMHLGLATKGPYRGWAIVWDVGPNQGQTCTSTPLTPWGMFNAEANPRVFVNNILPHAAGTGNLGCSGHAWTMDGRLLVVGGNILHDVNHQGCILGGFLRSKAS